MTRRQLDLSDAYAVQTPEDNRHLYKQWADTYESEFVIPRGYVYHQGVASIFAKAQPALHAPVLDVGCGTGMAGLALSKLGYGTIDGIDLSPEMIAKARAKDTYRSLLEADLTNPVALPRLQYPGFVSVGVFTHGHLGPEPIRYLLTLAAPGAVFALGVNAEHYHESDFEGLLSDLIQRNQITPVRQHRVRIYTTADDEHGEDQAIVLCFASHG